MSLKLGRSSGRDNLVPISIRVEPLGATLDCDLVIDAPEWEPYSQTYTCDLATVANGASVDLTWKILRSEELPGPALGATATVSGSVDDPDPANNQDEATIE